MLFLAGFPSSIYLDVIKDIVKSAPSELVNGLPANERGDYSNDYIEECFDTLLAYHRGRPRCFDKGLVIIVFRSLGSASIKSFEHMFYPFAIVREVSLDRRVASSGAQLARDKNEVSRRTIIAAKRAVKVRNQVTTYLASRCNRTPFLLPIGHFGEAPIGEMIKEAWGILKDEDNAGLVFDKLAKEFEKQHPFIRMKRNTGYFINAHGVEFRSPGRDLHGITHPNVDGHQERCFFNGTLRIGGQVRQGFHYDCTYKGGKYSGTFESCHGEVISREGNPHLNVYPNDYIR